MEYKFRAWSKNKNRMFNHEEIKEASDGMVKAARLVMENQGYKAEIPFGLFLPIDDEDMTFIQFTGAYDSTKWEELTDTEQADFMSDGNNIRFKNDEAAKKAWKGKEIYAGDCLLLEEYVVGFVEYNPKEAAFMIKEHEGIAADNFNPESYDENDFGFYNMDSVRVIGNKYEFKNEPLEGEE